MVLVDGKAVLSCSPRSLPLEGAEVTTIEGLGTPDRPNLVQQAFVLAGAVQCGFCIPGMIVTAEALLGGQPGPHARRGQEGAAAQPVPLHGLREDHRRRRSWRAASSAARSRPRTSCPPPDAPLIGDLVPAPVRDGQGHRHGALRRRHPAAGRARDRGGPQPARPRPDPRHRHRGGCRDARRRRGHDRERTSGAPTASSTRSRTARSCATTRSARWATRSRSSPPATKAQALAAAEAVVVDYEPLPVLDSPAAALADGAPRVHEDTPNLCYSQPIIKGDAAAAFAAAGVRGRGALQDPDRPPGARWSRRSASPGWRARARTPSSWSSGRSINIHLHMQTLQEALGWEAIRYEEPFAGGQFGIKVEVITEGIAGAAALHFNRAVRYVPSLAESMLITSKRHPFDIETRLGRGRRRAPDRDGDGHHRRQRRVHVAGPGDRQPGAAHAHQLVPRAQPGGDARGSSTRTTRGAAPPAGPGRPRPTTPSSARWTCWPRRWGSTRSSSGAATRCKPGEAKATGHVVTEWPFPGLCDAIEGRYEAALADAARQPADGPVRRGVGLGAAVLRHRDAGRQVDRRSSSSTRTTA